MARSGDRATTSGGGGGCNCGDGAMKGGAIKLGMGARKGMGKKLGAAAITRKGMAGKGRRSRY